VNVHLRHGEVPEGEEPGGDSEAEEAEGRNRNWRGSGMDGSSPGRWRSPGRATVAKAIGQLMVFLAIAELGRTEFDDHLGVVR
jgi:hypothetical protein